jgi:peptide/nickel transport system substrate-binding protein
VQRRQGKEETYASRNSQLGTGGYRITGWQPDQRITMTANPDWWDKANASNVTEVVYSPIKSRRRPASPRCCRARWTW